MDVGKGFAIDGEVDGNAETLADAEASFAGTGPIDGEWVVSDILHVRHYFFTDDKFIVWIEMFAQSESKRH